MNDGGLWLTVAVLLLLSMSVSLLACTTNKQQGVADRLVCGEGKVYQNGECVRR